jgi:hypothetical protein
VLNIFKSCILQWVQCDKCECWQHQICALFNGRRNDGGQAEYTCPNCYVEEVKRGLRKPLPQSAVLGAKDLPRTVLSDHIEDRLFKRLKQEKQDRAAAAGKNIDEVSETRFSLRKRCQINQSEHMTHIFMVILLKKTRICLKRMYQDSNVDRQGENPPEHTAPTGITRENLVFTLRVVLDL